MHEHENIDKLRAELSRYKLALHLACQGNDEKLRTLLQKAEALADQVEQQTNTKIYEASDS